MGLSAVGGYPGAVPDEEEPVAGDVGGAPTSGQVGSGAWNSWVRRNFSSQRFLKPRPESASEEGDGGADGSSSKAGSVRAAVNNIDAREKRIGIFAVIFELSLTAVVVIPYLTHKIKPTSNKSDYLKTLSAVHLFLIEGLVLAVFFILGIYFKRRALLGFAALAAGIWLVELPALRIFGLAYLALGMWLLLRGLRSQQAAAGRGAKRPPPPPRSKKKAAAAGSQTLGRTAPKPSKRYTPPKPSRRPAPKKREPANAERKN